MGVSGRFVQAQGFEEVELFRLLTCEGGLGCRADTGDMLLNAFQKIESGARACAVPLGFQAHAHDAVEDESQEADHGVGADAIRQTVMHRRNLDVGFQHAEAALDLCEALVARDGLSGGEVGGIGDQRKLAVEELGLGDGVFIDRPAEPIRIQIGLEEAGELSLRNGTGEAAVGTSVGGATALGGLSSILGVEFADHLLGHGVELSDARPAPLALFSGTQRIMVNDQAMTRKTVFGQPGLVEGHMPEGLDQITVTACGDGQDELQRAPTLLGQRCQGVDVVEAQKPAIGHEDDALDRDALQDCGEHRLQRPGFGHVARMHGMHERQAFGGLHDAKHELAGDAARLLVHAVGADVVVDLAFAVDAYGRQVVKDHGQIAIHEGTDLAGQPGLHAIDIVHQRVHGAQEMMMFDLGGHLRHGHGVQPAQAPKLACGVAQAVEDHCPYESIRFDLAPPRPHGAAERTVEPQILPKLVQGKDVAIGLGALDLDGKRRIVAAPDGPVQTVDQGVELGGVQILKSAEVGDDPMADLALVVAIALDQLEILAPTGSRDLRVHVATI